MPEYSLLDRSILEKLDSPEELERLLKEAAYATEMVLARAHAFRDCAQLRWSAARLGVDVMQLLKTLDLISLTVPQERKLRESCRDA